MHCTSLPLILCYNYGYCTLCSGSGKIIDRTSDRATNNYVRIPIKVEIILVLLTEKGYLSEISLNGRTKGYIRSENFEQLIGKIR